MNKKKIKLTIESRLENLSLVSTSVNNICTQIPISPKEAQIIELCVVEAVVNSIKHAYLKVPDNLVEIDLEIVSGLVTIKVIDSGKSMDPELLEKTETFSDCILPEKIEAVPSSGRGLMIIKTFMDSVSYQIETTQNILTMKKNITIVEEYSI